MFQSSLNWSDKVRALRSSLCKVRVNTVLRTNRISLTTSRRYFNRETGRKWKGFGSEIAFNVANVFNRLSVCDIKLYFFHSLLYILLKQTLIQIQILIPITIRLSTKIRKHASPMRWRTPTVQQMSSKMSCRLIYRLLGRGHRFFVTIGYWFTTVLTLFEQILGLCGLFIWISLLVSRKTGRLISSHYLFNPLYCDFYCRFFNRQVI